MAAIFAVTALTLAAAGPVGAQEFGVLEINPHEGPVGSLVEGFVPPEVIAESCSDFEEFSADLVTVLAIPGGPLFVAGDEYAVEQGWGGFEGAQPLMDSDPEAWAFLVLMLGVAALEFFGEERQAVFEQLFVLTFASLETELVGELGSYDPETGEGAVEVPAVDPGLWAVAAVCLGVNMTPTMEGTVAPAVAVGAEMAVAEFGPDGPYPNPVFAIVADPEGTGAVVLSIIAAMLPLDPLGEGILTVQGGPWVDLFCVWDTDGACHPDLRDLTLAELEALEDDGLLGEGMPAAPVGASPRFTG